jgi:hypothetical protein
LTVERPELWRDRIGSVRSWSIFAIYLALSGIFCWPLFVQPLAQGAGDWDQHTLYYAAVMRNAAFGDLPFWNPWYCGGNVLWANPQTSLVSPVYLLTLVMPITLAMKINVLAHYVTGCIGMHLVVRRIIGVKELAVVVYLVSLFVFSGAIALHLAAGHTIYLPVLLLPLLVYCFWQAAEGRRRSVVSGAAVLAFSILNGGSHVLPLAAVLLGGLGVTAIVAGRTLKPLIVAAAILILGCAYAAPRIAPVMAFIRSPYFQDTRPVKEPDFMSVKMLLVSFWDPAQPSIKGKVTPGVQLYGWQEYGNYLGAGATLALISAIWILVFRWRANWREVSTALVLIMVLLLTAGEFAPYAPARWFRTLPLISNFRIPSRYTLLVSLTGALCVAFAARACENLQPVSRRRWLVRLACVAGICELVILNRRPFENVFVLAADTQSHLFDRVAPTVSEHQFGTPGGPRVHRSFMLDSMLAGVSPLDCYEPLKVKRVAQLGPMAIRGEGDVTISNQTFAPNRITARAVVGREPARVILNENFAAGWTSNAGRVRAALPAGQPSVELPAGYSAIITFSYVPPGLGIGLAVLVVAAGVSVGLCRK